jgi:hypothetical protein
MASEPQPPTVHEGADPDSVPVPTNAEDRKTAAALSSLSGRDDDDSKAGKEVDTEALGKAMKNLDVSKDGGGTAEKKKKKVIRVEAGDVALLVSTVPPGGDKGSVGADAGVVG